jgi:hypothetical protein
MLWSMHNPRALWVGLFALWAFLLQPAAPTRAPAPAQASVSVALTLEELVDASDRAVVGRAVERRSEWAHVGGSRRIVTYTKVRIDRTVYGKDTTVWVRTLGGVVGKIGQHVSGEARLSLGKPSLLFLTELGDGLAVVTARAQGHFPVAADAKGRPVLRASPDRGKVLPRRKGGATAHETLVGRQLESALTVIRQARERSDDRR